jgi:tRNA A-37 threonylcarbamoyl transferase component Bud32
VATPTAAELRRTGRHPRVPFAIPLGEDTRITVTRVLRVLPGKRIVGEGELNGQQVLVKLFIAKTGFRHLRRELAGIQALQRGALPTPGLHPASPAVTPAGHLLLTEFLAGSEPLDIAPGDDPDRQLQRFELAFALLGRLHRAGLTHSDLHPGNLLRHKDTLYILDGDAVKPPPRGRALDTGKAIDNLATLLEMAPGGEERLLAAYRNTNPGFAPNPRQLRRALHNKRTHSHHRYMKKVVRDSTQLAVNRHFRRLTIALRSQLQALAEVLSNPDAALQRGQPLKTGGSSTVVRSDSDAGPLVIKRYNLKGPGHAFLRLWQPSRALISWQAGFLLRSIGVNTPEPLAMIEERLGALRRRAWLICRHCPGVPLAEQLRGDREPSPQEAAALERLFTTLHREQISHGDLKASNIYWHDGQLFLLDLDATVRRRFAFTHARAWHRDRARLLRNWPSDSPLHRWLDRHLPR